MFVDLYEYQKEMKAQNQEDWFKAHEPNTQMQDAWFKAQEKFKEKTKQEEAEQERSRS